MAKDTRGSASKNVFVRLLGNERYQSITIPIFAIVLSLIAISVVILLIGKNPLDAFRSLLQGSGWLPKSNYAGGKSMFTDFMELLDAMTPMLFAALAVAVALKCGLFNIGVSGQMLLGAFLATVTVGYSGLSAFIAKPLVLLIGMAAGALAGALMGWLKYKFNIHEVVTSIMLNYIIQYVVSFFIKTSFTDPVTRQSTAISPASRLEVMNVIVGGAKARIPLCFVLAIAVAVLLWWFLTKTKQGLELQAVGVNTKASDYAGIRVGRTLIFAMTISGALGGLAGVTYYLGYFNSIEPGTLSSLGFDSIAVALLGNMHPIGVIFSSLLITTLTHASNYMSSVVGVRQEIASLIVGMILLFSACSGFVKMWIERVKHVPGEGGEQQ
jgi:simple sugar transport system permease protein